MHYWTDEEIRHKKRIGPKLPTPIYCILLRCFCHFLKSFTQKMISQEYCKRAWWHQQNRKDGESTTFSCNSMHWCTNPHHSQKDCFQKANRADFVILFFLANLTGTEYQWLLTRLKKLPVHVINYWIWTWNRILWNVQVSILFKCGINWFDSRLVSYKDCFHRADIFKRCQHEAFQSWMFLHSFPQNGKVKQRHL